MNVIAWRRFGLIAPVFLAAMVLAGCSTLPTSGPVHVQASGKPKRSGDYQVTPSGPGTGDSPQQIVEGFLTALQTSSPSTSVARSYLTGSARRRWNPTHGTILYDSATYTGRGHQVRARLANVHRLDARGAWQPGESGRASIVDFRLVKQNGQWRISNPRDSLLLPLWFLQSEYKRTNTYYFDQTGTVLVPQPIFVRRNQALPDAVRALLAGPSPGGVTRSAFPAGTALDSSVSVSASGVAEIPLSDDVLRVPPPQLHKAVAQLARTLGQLPGVKGFRLTVDRAPLQLAGGDTDMAVGGNEYDPESRGESAPLLTIHAGRLELVDGESLRPAAGPLGQPGFALRSLAQDPDGTRTAVVTADGRHLLLAPLSGSSAPDRVRRSYAGADLLRPAYDRFGQLWFVDDTSTGARVYVVHGGRPRQVDVPGVTGRSVRAFALSQDGTRFVAVLASRYTPTLRASDVVRSPTGSVARVTPSRGLPVDNADLGAAVDVGFRTPSELVLLTHGLGKGQYRASLVNADGSPGDETPTTTESIPAGDPSLVVPPSHAQPLLLVDKGGRTYRLHSLFTWVRAAFSGLTAASYG